MNMSNRKRLYRPVGEVTRGKTHRNRLRRVDIFLLMYAGDLLRRREGLYQRAMYVDLGYGAEAFTTLESADRFRNHNQGLPVMGVEIDPERVEAAQIFSDEKTYFRLGGFNLPLTDGETVRIMRAFNVLRQYEENEVLSAHQLMGSYLLPGGLLIEGTSDPLGRIWVANLIRRNDAGLLMEGLLFSTNFRWGFEPGIFQPVLPKNFIHRMVPGEIIYDFMEAWKEAARQTVTVKTLGLRQWFSASAKILAEKGYSIDLRRKYLQKGFLLWKRNIPIPPNA
jgi:hypothetical protein